MTDERGNAYGFRQETQRRLQVNDITAACGLQWSRGHADVVLGQNCQAWRVGTG